MQSSTCLLKNHEALGTIWHIEVFNQLSEATKGQLRDKIIQIVTDFEESYSRFKPDSCLSFLNRNRSIADPTPEFIDLIQLGMDFNITTNGVFNFMIGDTLASKGYGQSFTNRQDELRLNQPNIQIYSNKIELKSEGSLDFGGYGKGYLIDKIAELLISESIDQIIINGGGDIFASHQHGDPVKIVLNVPNETDDRISVSLKDSAICSSSTFIRRWQNETGDHTHIIDTETNQSIKDAYTYVSANKCVIADMLATTFCIKSSQSFIDEMKNHYKFNLL